MRMKGTGSIYQRGFYYYLRTIENGKPKAKSLKRWDASGRLVPCRTLSEAQEAAAEIYRQKATLQEIKTREDAIYELSKTRSQLVGLNSDISRLWEFFKESTGYDAHVSEHRKRAMKYAVDSFVSFCAEKGVSKGAGITKKFVSSWLQREVEGKSNRTYNERLSILKQVFGATYEMLGLSKSPISDMKPRLHHKIAREVFTQEQVDKIVGCFERGFFSRCVYKIRCGRDHHIEERVVYRPYAVCHMEEYYLAFLFGVTLGCRLKDAVSMRWANIDLDKKKIRYTPQKTRRSTGVEVNAPIVDSRLFDALVKARGGGSEFVTPHLEEIHRKDDQYVSGKFVKLFNIACEFGDDAKREGRRLSPSLHGFHALRHTFISFCANSGVSPSVCAAVAGIDPATVMRVYTHITEETKRKELERIFGKKS